MNLWRVRYTVRELIDIGGLVGVERAGDGCPLEAYVAVPSRNIDQVMDALRASIKAETVEESYTGVRPKDGLPMRSGRLDIRILSAEWLGETLDNRSAGSVSWRG